MLEKIKEGNFLVKGPPADKMEANRDIILTATLMATVSTTLLLFFAIQKENQPLIWGLLYLTVINLLCLIAHYSRKVKVRTIVYTSSVLYGVFLAVSPAMVGVMYSAPLIIVDLLLFNWLFGRGERFRFIITGVLLACAATFYILANLLGFPYHPDFQVWDFLVNLVFFGFFFYILLFYQREIDTTETAFLTNEEHYRTLFENSPVGVLIVDIDREKKGLDCNRKMSELFLADRKDLLDGNMLVFSPEVQPNQVPTAQHLHRILKKYRAHKKPLQFEWQFQRADGVLFDAEVTMSPIHLKGEEVEMMLIRDVTETKKAADALNYSNSLLAASLESTADGILVVDENREVTQFNNKFLELWQISKAEAEQKNSYQLLEFVRGQLEKPKDWLNRVESLYKNPEAVSFDTFNLKDGRVFERYSQPQWVDQTIVGRVWSFRDITQKHYAERALMESEAKYRTLFENAFDGLLIYDLEQQKIIECNQRMVDYLGVSINSLMNAYPQQFLPEYQPNGHKTTDLIKYYTEETLKKGKTQNEWELQRVDGVSLYAEVTVFQLPKPNTHLLVIIFKDITEKKKQETIIKEQVNELNNKNIDLERYIESNMQLENFAYIASHDLKAPMRTIVSFSQLLDRSAKSKLDDKEREYLQFIITAIYNMRSLVEDLLAYSRVNAQTHQTTPLSVRKLIEDVIAEMQIPIAEKEAIIKLDSMPAKIDGDPTKMRQLFQNMIANAIKFNRPGVRPNVMIGCEDRKSKWVFYIQDNGIGIQEEFHQKIFLLFRKLHSSMEYEGTGIGLALCKKIVEQHKGKIWLDSEPGRGTTFYFSLPKTVAGRLNYTIPNPDHK